MEKSNDQFKKVFGEVIYAYTRKQAIEDGVLVDVSTFAKEKGFLFPVALTQAVWGIIEDIPNSSGQDVKGRLWDILFTLKMKIYCIGGGDIIFFKVIMKRTMGSGLLELKAVCGPGDEGEPVITVMLPGED